MCAAIMSIAWNSHVISRVDWLKHVKFFFFCHGFQIFMKATSRWCMASVDHVTVGGMQWKDTDAVNHAASRSIRSAGQSGGSRACQHVGRGGRGGGQLIFQGVQQSLGLYSTQRLLR